MTLDLLSWQKLDLAEPSRPCRDGQKPLESFKQKNNMILFTFLKFTLFQRTEVKMEVDQLGGHNDNPDK